MVVLRIRLVSSWLEERPFHHDKYWRPSPSQDFRAQTQTSAAPLQSITKFHRHQGALNLPMRRRISITRNRVIIDSESDNDDDDDGQENIVNNYNNGSSSSDNNNNKNNKNANDVNGNSNVINNIHVNNDINSSDNVNASCAVNKEDTVAHDEGNGTVKRRKKSVPRRIDKSVSASGTSASQVVAAQGSNNAMAVKKVVSSPERTTAVKNASNMMAEQVSKEKKKNICDSVRIQGTVEEEEENEEQEEGLDALHETVKITKQMSNVKRKRVVDLSSSSDRDSGTDHPSHGDINTESGGGNVASGDGHVIFDNEKRDGDSSDFDGDSMEWPLVRKFSRGQRRKKMNVGNVRSSNKGKRDESVDEGAEGDDESHQSEKSRSSRAPKRKRRRCVRHRGPATNAAHPNDLLLSDDDHSILRTVSRKRRLIRHLSKKSSRSLNRKEIHDMHEEGDDDDEEEEEGEEGDDDNVSKDFRSLLSGKKYVSIKRNVYISKITHLFGHDEVPVCQCDPWKGNCGDSCINRLIHVECDPNLCPCGDRCTNNRFQNRIYARTEVRRAERKGFGLFAMENIASGSFISEYVGEMMDETMLQKRIDTYEEQGRKHFYFLQLGANLTIDATIKGNKSRFMNHSCEPNCETKKWIVDRRNCVGLFTTRNVTKGEELTFDYAFERYGATSQKCYCGAAACRGIIRAKPTVSERQLVERTQEEMEHEWFEKQSKRLHSQSRTLLKNLSDVHFATGILPKYRFCTLPSLNVSDYGRFRGPFIWGNYTMSRYYTEEYYSQSYKKKALSSDEREYALCNKVFALKNIRSGYRALVNRVMALHTKYADEQKTTSQREEGSLAYDAAISLYGAQQSRDHDASKHNEETLNFSLEAIGVRRSKVMAMKSMACDTDSEVEEREEEKANPVPSNANRREVKHAHNGRMNGWVPNSRRTDLPRGTTARRRRRMKIPGSNGHHRVAERHRDGAASVKDDSKIHKMKRTLTTVARTETSVARRAERETVTKKRLHEETHPDIQKAKQSRSSKKLKESKVAPPAAANASIDEPTAQVMFSLGVRRSKIMAMTKTKKK